MAPECASPRLSGYSPMLAPLYVKNNAGEFCQIGIITRLKIAHSLMDVTTFGDAAPTFLRGALRGHGEFEVTALLNGD